MTDVKRLRAARALAAGSSQAKAAREAEVHRATIKRWMDDADFIALIEAERPDEPEAEVAATKGLNDLVPQAITVLEQALHGQHVTPAAARVALDVIKAAATLTPKEFGTETDTPSWTALLEALDEQDRARTHGRAS